MPEKRKSFFTFLLLFLFASAFLAHAAVIDKIRVIVNDEIITRGDIDRVLLPIYVQYKNIYTGRELKEKIDEAERNVKKRLIEDKLLLSEARRKEIEATTGELAARVEEARRRFSTEEEFEAALKQEGITLSQLEQGFREKIMIEKLVNMEIANAASISPTELLNYYKSHLSGFKKPQKVKLRSILLRIKKERPEAETQKLAQKILYRLREGGDFGLLAREYSDGPYADSGGDMGWVERGQLMERVNDLIFRLDEGDISGILKTKLGFHIFKVEDKEEAKLRAFNEAKEEIERLLYNRKRKESLTLFLEKLKENAYIAFR